MRECVECELPAYHRQVVLSPTFSTPPFQPDKTVWRCPRHKRAWKRLTRKRRRFLVLP